MSGGMLARMHALAILSHGTDYVHLSHSSNSMARLSSESLKVTPNEIQQFAPNVSFTPRFYFDIPQCITLFRRSVSLYAVIIVLATYTRLKRESKF